MHHVFMYPKSVLTDSSHIMTGCGRVGQNRLLEQVELHTTGCVQFYPVFRTLRKFMNRLRFRFDPKREKNRTEPDFQTLSERSCMILQQEESEQSTVPFRPYVHVTHHSGL